MNKSSSLLFSCTYGTDTVAQLIAEFMVDSVIWKLGIYHDESFSSLASCGDSANNYKNSITVLFDTVVSSAITPW